MAREERNAPSGGAADEDGKRKIDGKSIATAIGVGIVAIISLSAISSIAGAIAAVSQAAAAGAQAKAAAAGGNTFADRTAACQAAADSAAQNPPPLFRTKQWVWQQAFNNCMENNANG